MGIQMAIPFAVLPSGAVSTISDLSTQVEQRVEAILGTELGGRLMRATYGLPLSQFLFASDASLLAGELATDVSQQLNLYEPGLTNIQVKAESAGTPNGLAKVDVSYNPVLSASPQTAVSNIITIEVGGTVVPQTSTGGSS